MSPFHYLPVMLFVILCKAILMFGAMKAIRQYFPVVLFLLYRKVVPTLESADPMLK